MDIAQILAELHTELKLVENALANLRSIAAKSAPRRGRPPAWLGQNGKPTVRTDRKARVSAPTAQARRSKPESLPLPPFASETAGFSQSPE